MPALFSSGPESGFDSERLKRSEHEDAGMDDSRRIVDAAEVPDDGTLLVTLRTVEDDEQREAILTTLSDGTVAAWLNYCQHWTDVRLDTGDGAPMRDGEITCRRHAATFDPESGQCTFGPCEGAFLNDVDVVVEDDGVYLTDEAFALDSMGPAEAHTGGSSTSPGERLGF
jgi:nitrite reductase/ring-hydroxylating ferredoxin subunit